jgi:hypothetical protein
VASSETCDFLGFGMISLLDIGEAMSLEGHISDGKLGVGVLII